MIAPNIGLAVDDACQFPLGKENNIYPPENAPGGALGTDTGTANTATGISSAMRALASPRKNFLSLVMLVM